MPDRPTADQAIALYRQRDDARARVREAREILAGAIRELDYCGRHDSLVAEIRKFLEVSDDR